MTKNDFNNKLFYFVFDFIYKTIKRDYNKSKKIM